MLITEAKTRSFKEKLISALRTCNEFRKACFGNILTHPRIFNTYLKAFTKILELHYSQSSCCYQAYTKIS